MLPVSHVCAGRHMPARWICKLNTLQLLVRLGSPLACQSAADNRCKLQRSLAYPPAWPHPLVWSPLAGGRLNKWAQLRVASTKGWPANQWHLRARPSEANSFLASRESAFQPVEQNRCFRSSHKRNALNLAPSQVRSILALVGAPVHLCVARPLSSANVLALGGK